MYHDDKQPAHDQMFLWGKTNEQIIFDNLFYAKFLPVPTVRTVSNDCNVNWLSLREDLTDDDDVTIISFCGSSTGLFVCELTCGIEIFVVSNIFEVGLIEGNSVIVAEDILSIVKSILAFGMAEVVGLSLVDDVNAPTEPFFNDIWDGFCRGGDDVIVEIVNEDVLFNVNFLRGRIPVEADERFKRRDNNCSGGFGVPVERTDAIRNILRKKWVILK